MDLTAATSGAHSSLTDPSDFASTPLASIAEVDGLLRCQICKDFYTNAVITSCFHSFCSLCIRRCLAVDGRCPTCRSSEQESKLRRNVTLQEVADSFVNARPNVLNVARQAASPSKHATSTRGSKRKRADADVQGSQEASAPVVPRTRSQRKRTILLPSSSSQTAEESAAANSNGDTVVIEDSDQDYAPTSSPLDGAEDNIANAAAPPESEPNDGLVPCPICTTRMKPEAVFTHLDICDGRKYDRPPPRTATPTHQPTADPAQRQTLPRKPPPERLPQVNYSILKDGALRKKLSDIGIPSWGPKPLLVRRHTEWINLWNANCDSARPRSRRELLSELDGWERSQGGHARNADPGGFGGSVGASNGSSIAASGSVMRKDFDGQGWARKNKTDFDALIASARQGRNKPNDHKPPSSETRDADPQINAPTSTPTANEQTPQPTQPPNDSSPPPLTAQSPSTMNHLQPLLHGHQRRTSSPVPGFTSTLDPAGTSRLAETRRRPSTTNSQPATPASAPSSPVFVPTLKKSDSSLPDRMFASLGAGTGPSESPDVGGSGSGSARSRVRKKPMFEMPGDPVTDADTAGFR